MDRSQSLRKLPSVPGSGTDDSEMDVRRALSHPDRLNQTAPEMRSQAQPTSPRSSASTSDLRRTNVQLRKDLEQERLYSKRLRREKVMEVRQAREDEQRKFASLQTELKSRLHREKVNELTALKEQMFKEKEKEIVQVVKQKDEIIKSAQLNWAKEKEEIYNKVNVEVFNEAREEAKRNLEGERVRLEQDIIDLSRRNKELEESYKSIQEQDKRKAEDIRRMFREHENELEKMKRNSWQESRRQMSEIRQLLNIVEQLEKKLGIESGHSIKLRLQKDNLSEELKKLQSSDYLGLGLENSPEQKQSGGQDRILHRRNVELSSLVKKLDEKNQQLITRNTELLSELEKLEWDTRSKNRKGDKKIVDLIQTVKKLELRNKTLLDEVNNMKRKAKSRIPGSPDVRTGKERQVRPHGPTQQEKDEAGRLKAQLRDQSKTIVELKQRLMEKERRIDLLKQRRKSAKRKQLSLDSLSVPDDDAVSILSDVSGVSELQAGDNDSDSRRVRKLAKELLALERAYALLQATAGSAVDAEREETEKQQLQSDLIDSQSRIHELERMLEQNIQGTGDLAALQEDNKALYQKLVAAEKERDAVKYQLDKNREDVKDLQDQRELLEFELEEMSQLSAMGSDDENPFSPRPNVLLDRGKSEDDIPPQLSAEEIKACLEKLENEKNNLLTLNEQNILKQARTLIDSSAKEIEILQSSDSSLKVTISDLEEKHLKEMEMLSNRNMATQGTMTDLMWTELVELENQYRDYLENLPGMEEINRKVETEERDCMTDVTSVDIEELELFHKQNLVNQEDSLFGRVPTREQDSLTELTLPDIEYFEELEALQEESAVDGDAKPLVGKLGIEQEDKGIVTDFTLADVEYLEEMELEHQDCHANKDVGSGNGNGFGFGFTEYEDKASMTDFSVSDLEYLEEVEETHQNCVMERNADNNKTSYGWKERKERGCGTELTIPDLKYLEEFESVHQDCTKLKAFEDREITSVNTNRSEQECMTELTLTDLQYLEEVDFVHQDCGVENDLQTGQLESKIDQKENCTMTDLTIPEVDYLEQLEAVHKEIVEDYKYLKSNSAAVVEKENKEVATELTFEDLKFLEELEAFHKENEEAIENVFGEKLCRLGNTKGYSSEIGFGRKRIISCTKAETTNKCSIEVMGDLTNDGVKYLEEFESKNRDVIAQNQHKDNITLAPNMQSVSRSQSIKKADSGVGTDLTIPDLEHLEETENLYRELSEKGVLGGADANTRDDKNTETVLTLVGLQQLEKLAKSAAGEDAMKKGIKHQVGMDRKPGVATETSALYVNTAKLEHEEPGFDSIQVVLKPSHKQEVIVDSLSRKEEEYQEYPPEERPPLTHRSSSTVSVSSVHSWGRSFTVTSGAHDNEVVSADDQSWPEELERERQFSEINKEDGIPSLKYIRKITEEEEISPEVCDIEEALSDQFGLTGEDLNTVSAKLLDDEAAKREGEIPQGLPGVFDATEDDQEVFYTEPSTNQMNTAVGDTDARRGSAVEQFDQFLKERKQSELSTMLSLRQSTDDEPHQEEASLTDVEELVSANELLKNKVKQLQDYHDKTAEVIEDLEKANSSLREKGLEREDEEGRLKTENATLTERVQELERSVGADELVKENTDLRGQIRELSVKETQLLRDQIEELKDYKNKSVEIIEDLVKENAALTEKTQETEITEHLETENDELKTRIRQLEKTLAATSEELTIENGTLKEQIAEFENGECTAAEVSEELKKENELLKGQLEQLKIRNEKIAEVAEALKKDNELLKEQRELLEERQDRLLEPSEALEKENELLREQIAQLVETNDRADEGSEELEKENKLLRDHVEHLEDGKDRFIETCEALRKENELLRDQIQQLENEKEKDIQVLQDLQRENKELKHQSGDGGDDRLKLPEDLTRELEMLKNKVQELEEQRDKCVEAIDDYEKEVKLLRDQSSEFDESRGAFTETIGDLKTENQQLISQMEELEDNRDKHAEITHDLENEIAGLREKILLLEESHQVSENMAHESSLFRKKIEELENAKEFERENGVLIIKVQELEQQRDKCTEAIEEYEKEMKLLRDQSGELDESRGVFTETIDELRTENDQLRNQIQELEDNRDKYAEITDDLENENTGLRDKVMQLEKSNQATENLGHENSLLRDKIEELENAKKGDLTDDELELLYQKIEQLKEAEQKIGMLNETNTVLRQRIDQIQYETTDGRSEASTRDGWSETDEIRRVDQAVQASVVVQSTDREIQTAGDLMKLVELSYDGSIPDHIAKELEKLKKENRELFEELMELRRKAQEAAAGFVSEDRRNLTERGKRKDRTSPDETAVRPSQSAHVQISSRVLTSEPGVMSERTENDSVPSTDDLHERIDELSKLEIDLEDVGFSGSPEETQDLEDSDLEDGSPPPPPPDMSPPPIPTGPPPDFTNDTVLALDPYTEDLLGHSPPRTAANLRPASRQRPRDEEPLLQEQYETQVENEPDLLGAATECAEGPTFWRPPPLSPASQSTKPRMRPILSEKSPKVSAPSVSKQGGHLEERASQESSRKAPPPTLPKPKRTDSREWPPKQHGLPVVPPSTSRFVPAVAVPLQSALLRQGRGHVDPEEMGLPPRGSVLARASSINQGQLDALNEKILFLEKQLKNKESVIRTMRVEATELETQAMLERRDKEVKILEDEIAFLKQENQKKERELLVKIGEVNRRGYEVEQWKAEANSSERQRKRMESAYLNLQNQLRTLHSADSKLAQLEAKHTGTEKHNWELSEKVKKLEKTEKEFKELEYNIQVLQNQLQDLESVEKDRDELLQKLQIVEQQRDELLRKGRMVESERNDFLRNNKMMEMQRDDLEGRYEMMNKTNASLKTKLAELEQDFKETQNRSHDVQHERNFVQSQCNKLQAERDELQKRLADVTQERNRLENLVAELQDFNRDHLKLEEGFHTLRLKVAELTRQKDDAEMQIPTLKAKTALLKQACKEKDGLIDKLNNEIQELRHSIATSTLDDLSKIRSYGYSSPETYVKFSRKNEFERALKPRTSEDLIESKLNEQVGSSARNSEQKRKKKGSSRGSHAQKPYVALFDYDPYKSTTSGHPELELTLRKGDHMTIFGEMDLNGYFEAELNGVRGLVPSLFVEEVDDNIARLSNERTKSKALRDSPTDAYIEPYGPFNDISPQGYKPDNMSSGHSTMSVGTSYAGSEPQRQCFVALYDYSPYQSCTTGRPELELAFKKGDILTVIGDMDTSGYYKAEMNGRTGLVPSNFVEEVSSSSYLQSSSTKAPEQILGVLDNIQVPGRRTGREIMPAPVISNALYSGYPNNDVTYRTQYPQASPVQYGTVTVDVIRPVSSVMSLPRAQPIVAITTAQDPTSVTSRPTPLVTTNVSRPRQTRPVTTSGSVSSPGSLHVLRPVNQDAMLLGWTLPDMDEFGQSNGIPLKGYRIYANGDFKVDVKSAYMAKALVEDLDLRHPVQFAIQSVGEDGSLSKKVVAKFTDTISEPSISPRDNGEDYSSDDGEQFTTHVALYDYDPYQSSPNPNPAYELAFKEGDILRVTDTSRKDGFYHGELRGKKGLIPSNFVEEVAVAPSRRRGSRSHKRARNRGPRQAIPQLRQSNGHVSPTSPIPAGKRKTMVALYDYSPEEQSPQDNPDSELPFKKGQVITVIGGMNAAGFYQAEQNGHYALVPSSFLEEYIK